MIPVRFLQFLYPSPSHIGVNSLSIVETSSDPRHQLDTQSDDQQWAIVPRPGDDSGDGSHNQEASSHFDITLGWGRYKVTVFSWDMSIRRQANDCP